ncbi:hypothetical protein ANABIO32_39880 [Rossellomorea marisflavi]|nr:hypothetical protein ANABIO32_39880 [Rossellomorea marisflavi]
MGFEVQWRWIHQLVCVESMTNDHMQRGSFRSAAGVRFPRGLR